MKLIGITQRIIHLKDYKEIRDSLDQSWFNFLLKLRLFPILIPNNLKVLQILFKKIQFDGFILSGGDNLVKYGGKDLIRDQIEKKIIKTSISQNIALLGICRGMQAIQNFFGQKLEPIKNHVATIHEVSFFNKKIFCNSFHNLAAKTPIDCLETIAISKDIIEGIKHKKHPIYGIMWHPERCHPFTNFDKSLMKKIFNL